MRFFNTSGPVVPADHYCIPPLSRVDLDDVRRLVRDKRYFVLHAPRETGQGFTPRALETVWRRTQGQPWLVNALADATCFATAAGRDRRDPVTAGGVEAAQERLIVSRETHLDQLADKLREDRVRRVVGSLLSGGDEREFTARDIEYVRDLGLVARDPPLRIANPVYAEVVPRELNWAAQEGLVEETGMSAATALWTWRGCCAPSRRSSGSIRSTGWSGSTTGRRVRSFSCRRSCNASSTGAGGSSASTAWAAGARTF